MPPEHAAGVVDELPRDEAEKILELVEGRAPEDIQEVLEYPEHSAGRLMSPDFVAVREDATVEGAIKHIRDSVGRDRASRALSSSTAIGTWWAPFRCADC